MSLSKLTDDLNIVQSLDDEPNDIGGLTSEELKAKFDTAGNAIKDFINNTLTEEADNTLATKEEVQSVTLGQIPDGTITAEKIATGVEFTPSAHASTHSIGGSDALKSTDLGIDAVTAAKYFTSLVGTETVDQVLAWIADGKANNSNLFINGDFQNPVNQRGLLTYDDTYTSYTIDRFRISGNLSRTTSLSTDGLTLTATSSGTFMGEAQRIEWSKSFSTFFSSHPNCMLSYYAKASQNCLDYAGNLITTDESLIKIPVSILPSTISTAESNGYFNQSFGAWKLADGSNLPVGFSITFRKVKFQIGKISTLATDHPADYATELIKCMRYYEKSTLPYTTGSNIYTTIPFKVRKRITPSITTTPSYTPYAVGVDGVQFSGVIALTTLIADAEL